MFKFFRKIRQKLLLENLSDQQAGSFSKYLLYAAGEICLVMIGILLALQVNYWNENHKNQQAEHLLLKDLRQEFKINQNLFVNKLKAINQGINIHKNYLEKLASGNHTYEDMATYEIEIAVGAGTSAPVQGVINTLISSGDIKLIRNDALKYELTSWKDKMADLYENEQIHLNHIFKYTDYTNERIPQSANRRISNLVFYDLPQERIAALFLNMAKELTYRNFIFISTAHLEMQVKPKLETVIATDEKIIQLIEKELEL